MANGFILLVDWLVILLIRAAKLVGIFATAQLNVEPSKVEVALLAGDAVEFTEANLDLLMAGRFLELIFAGAESLAEHISVLRGHVEQRAFAGGLEVGGGGFIEMTDVVEFVAAGEIRPAGLAAHSRHFLRREQPTRGVEVAIRLLRGGNLRDEIVEILVEFRVGRERKRIG